jgi:hypothetical protein
LEPIRSPLTLTLSPEAGEREMKVFLNAEERECRISGQGYG